MISFVKTLFSSPLGSVRRKVLSSTTWAYGPKKEGGAHMTTATNIAPKGGEQKWKISWRN
jgi:hypothetical protein